MKSALVSLPLVGTMMFIPSLALAQDEGEEVAEEAPAEEAPAEEAPAEEAPADAAPAPAAAAATADTDSGGGEVDDDGVRFRGGISGGGGGLFLSGFSLGLGGIDGRLGVQINDLIGVYAQPQLAFYGGKVAGVSGFGGIVGGSAVVDFTFIDQIFAGIGGGYALINNPHGGELHFRAGGYPLMGFGEDGIRRTGLMLAADVRLFFVSGSVLVSPMASIGYEAF